MPCKHKWRLVVSSTLRPSSHEALTHSVNTVQEAERTPSRKPENRRLLRTGFDPLQPLCYVNTTGYAASNGIIADGELERYGKDLLWSVLMYYSNIFKIFVRIAGVLKFRS